MANVTGKGGFVKGTCPNPNGRPKVEVTARDLQKIMLEDFIFFTTDIAKKKVEEVLAICNDPEEQMLKKIIAKIFLKTYQEGDPARLMPIIERAIGKVKEVHQIDLNASDREFQEKVKAMSVPELQTYAGQLITQIKEVTSEKSN